MVSQNSINNTVADNDFSVNRSLAGTSVVDSTNHSSGVAGSNAIKRQQVADASAADPFIIHATATTRSWVHGMDTSDATSLKEGTAAAGTTTPSSATISRKVFTTGEQIMPLQPAFLAYLGAVDSNVTGAGAAYFLGTTTGLTEVYDIGGHLDPGPVAGGAVYTVPVSGIYKFYANILMTDITLAMTDIQIAIQTGSGIDVRGSVFSPGAVANFATMASGWCEIALSLTAADTVKFAVVITNGAGDTADIQGSATIQTYVGGYLLF